ncbi:hypothetical protein KF728_21100 [Candidatus Obscuribacterales bacterium]|nr:hypothetical protein [Candidatus Obscuribacterales bacterium]MBX3152668.1 hypothetical protein [Candidatus Obscuribacterales bacterium]
MRSRTSKLLMASLLICQFSWHSPLLQEADAEDVLSPKAQMPDSEGNVRSETNIATADETLPPPKPLRTVDDTAIKAAYSGPKYKKGVRKLNWKPEIGWNGLVVGKSTLADAEKKFGKAEKSHAGGPGGTQWVFKDPIRMWISDSTHVINAIEVYVSEQLLSETPGTVQDAQTMFGPLKQVDVVEGCTKESSLKRPGLTVNAKSMDKSAQVTTLFFSND